MFAVQVRTANNLIVREGPSLDSAELGRVRGGKDRYIIEEQEQPDGKIRALMSKTPFPDGKRGWVTISKEGRKLIACESAQPMSTDNQMYTSNGWYVGSPRNQPSYRSPPMPHTQCPHSL